MGISIYLLLLVSISYYIVLCVIKLINYNYKRYIKMSRNFGKTFVGRH